MAEDLNRSDLTPYCLYHAVPMSVDSNEPMADLRPGVQLYICQFAGCDLNWERRLAYFKTTTTQKAFQFGFGVRGVQSRTTLFC